MKESEVTNMSDLPKFDESVALDAPQDVISALSGKIGRLEGITAKTVYAPEDALKD